MSTDERRMRELAAATHNLHQLRAEPPPLYGVWLGKNWFVGNGAQSFSRSLGVARAMWMALAFRDSSVRELGDDGRPREVQP